MQIVLSQTSQTPLYEQIKEQIRAAVLARTLRPGDALPSLRELARDLRVSLITVTRAYSDLAAEGVIGSRRGKGTVVLDVDPARLNDYIETRLREQLAKAVQTARLGGMGLEGLHRRLDEAWRAADGEGARTESG